MKNVYDLNWRKKYEPQPWRPSCQPRIVIKEPQWREEPRRESNSAQTHEMLPYVIVFLLVLVFMVIYFCIDAKLHP
jgi:hypothetical protein